MNDFYKRKHLNPDYTPFHPRGDRSLIDTDEWPIQRKIPCSDYSAKSFNMPKFIWLKHGICTTGLETIRDFLAKKYYISSGKYLCEQVGRWFKYTVKTFTGKLVVWKSYLFVKFFSFFYNCPNEKFSYKHNSIYRKIEYAKSKTTMLNLNIFVKS